MKIRCKTYWQLKKRCRNYCYLSFPDENKNEGREFLKKIISSCKHNPKFEIAK